MFKSSVRLIILAVLLSTHPALGQKHPLPTSSSQPPTICFGCTGTNLFGQSNNGLPTASFSSPIAAHVGRLVDSSSTQDYQHIGFRTARAGKIRIASTQRGSAPPRVYVGIGEAVAAYSLSRFFTATLPGGMAPVSTINTGSRIGGPGRSPLEQITMFDAFLYPEATQSGWRVTFEDGQQRLGDFDFDDRGYLYAAYITFGWGIVRDNGETGGAHFQKVAQIQGDSTNITPRTIVVLQSEGRYYAVVSAEGTRALAIYDVTNPASPGQPTVRTGSEWGIRGWSKDENSQRLAILDQDFGVSIYNYRDFISGGRPIASYAASSGRVFADISFDEEGNLWMAESNLQRVASNALWRATPRSPGSSYTLQTFTPYGPGNFSPTVIDASAGFILLGGRGDRDGSVHLEARVLKVDNGQPRLLDDGNFFRRYYHSSLQGYAMPQAVPQYTTIHRGVKVYRAGARTYAIYNVHGMGDVFELQGNDVVNISVNTTSFGTTNPHSRQTIAGPFPGDPVKFTGSGSSGAQYELEWDFGNPEAGASNEAVTLPGQSVAHQFSGLDTTAKVLTARNIKATSRFDSAVNGTVRLALNVPVPRVVVTGRSDVLVQGESLDVVAGDAFSDASDGSVESHFATWTMDGAASHRLPSVSMPVGAIGSHTLEFKATYGRYDAQTWAATAPFEAKISGISYTVRPFVISLKEPVRSGSDVVFGAEGRVASDSSTISASRWLVKWALNGVTQATHDAELGTVPSLRLPQTSIGANSVVSVEVSVDPMRLSNAASPYAIHGSSMTLFPPDPVIHVTGCTQAGGACTVAARSAAGLPTSDWTFAWTVRNASQTVVQTGTRSPLVLSLTELGTYTVDVIASKGAFDGAAPQQTLSLQTRACGPPPQQSNIALMASCTTGCPVGQLIEFSVSIWGAPLQECDVVTWSFGDGSPTQTGAEVTHTYSTLGTFNVRATISNSSGNAPTSRTQSIAVVAPSTCTTPSNVTVSYSGSRGCGPAVTCETGEDISFSVRKNGGSLQGCDVVSWKFGDGGTSSLAAPTHTYENPGNHTLSVSITNEHGMAQASVIVPVNAVIAVKPVPVLRFTLIPLRGTRGVPVEFRVESNLDTTTGWLWDFGDGSEPDSRQSHLMGRSNSISHTFASGGMYEVTVSARNGDDSDAAQVGMVAATVAIDDPEYKYLLPVVVRAAGQHGSVWRTDVQIYNPGPDRGTAEPLKLTALFKGTAKTIEIADSTTVFRDFLAELVSGDEQGPVILTARSPYAPKIWTRTYNQTESGTFGQFIPAIPLDVHEVGPVGGRKYHLGGLRHDARYRTNLGFVNPTAETVTAHVTVHDDRRTRMGEFSVTLLPYQLDQFPITHPKAVPSLSPERPFSLDIDVPDGQWLVAYASLIDSASNDPIFIQALRASELGEDDFRTTVIPGVGRVGDWRSDVTIFNPAEEPIFVNLAYHDQTGATVATAENVVIRAGEFVQYADILRQGLFGHVPDSLGILRVSVPESVRTSPFPMSFARTYNDNGSGRTYGQGIAAFAMSRANVRPGIPALVPGIRNDERYRTNFGVTNVTSSPVTVIVKVLDRITGAETPIYQETLAPFQSVVGPVGITGAMSLKFEASGSDVWGFASIIDRGTLDPEYVAATPLAP